jgi:hypothetical protein
MLQIGLDFDMRLEEMQNRLDVALVKVVEHYETVQGISLSLEAVPQSSKLHQRLAESLVGYAMGLADEYAVKRDFQGWVKSCEVSA